ncbi:MAG: GcrA family cell cycle regulator [Brevundimonas sp.]|uniref:GcrA family cell cycle regulator n=1 Tax=Brevundimonas sp. TaxID=1871086 RepID=UPI003919878B
MSRWTETEQKTALSMWKDGQSAGEIAAILDRTRASVIGFVHRNLGPRRDPWEAQRQAQRIAARKSPRTPKPPRQPKAPSVRKGRSLAKETTALVNRLRAAPTTAETLAHRAQGLNTIAQLETPPADDAPLLIFRPASACAWPLGRPARPAEQRCCGARTSGDGPYCDEHSQRAYVAAPTADLGEIAA